MQIHKNIVPHEEIDNILFMIQEYHPEAFTNTTNNEHPHDGMQHLRMLPYNFVNVDGTCINFVLLSTANGDNLYAGCDWHVDGDDDETSVLLYLQGDPEAGGEFCTETEKHKFEVGTMFVLQSSERHKVEHYNGITARIALKWKFK